MSLKVGIVGAAGYAGAELIRLVLGHPEFELVAIDVYKRQDPWRPQRLRRQGPGLRRSPQAHPRGHRRRHRRAGHRQGLRHDPGPVSYTHLDVYKRQLYGDTAGAFAPIGGLYKTDVYAIARWRNERAERLAQLVTLPHGCGGVAADALSLIHI